MTRPLTVHNAQITTAAVEVKTLTISGKQVTLAVFRQLQEAELVAPDATLNGVPWGLVNYHPDKCSSGPPHVHVVWQQGTELRRARVDSPSASPRFWGESFDSFVAAARCRDEGHRRPGWLSVAGIGSGTVEWHFVADGLRCVVDSVGPDGSRDHECPSEDELLAAEAEFWREIKAEKERRVQLRQQWDALNALPQLFIAV